MITLPDPFPENWPKERRCVSCLEVKSVINGEFHCWFDRKQQKWFVRSDCAKCHNKFTQEKSSLSEYRNRAKKVIKEEAAVRAIVAVLKSDHDLFAYVVNKHPIAFKMRLQEAKFQIIDELEERSIRQGKRKAKNIDIPKLWNMVREELRSDIFDIKAKKRYPKSGKEYLDAPAS